MVDPATCGVCGGALALRFPGTLGGNRVTAAAFSPTCHEPGAHLDLYACERCGTVQQPALPAGGALLDLYRDMTDDAYLDEEAGRRATARRLLDGVERHVTRGRLLDVGCGHGLLLDEARRRGWSVTGIEPAAAAREHAAGALGLDVRDVTLDALAAEPFDAIVMADVIEHLEDPAGAVRDCARLVTPGGVVCVVTPDPSSRTARLAGRRWWGYLPAHTYLLPRRTLRGLLEREGFAPVADGGLRRSFTLGYWMAGLGERSGAVGAIAERVRRAPFARRRLTLSLGDERVIVARRRA